MNERTDALRHTARLMRGRTLLAVLSVPVLADGAAPDWVIWRDRGVDRLFARVGTRYEEQCDSTRFYIAKPGDER